MTYSPKRMEASMFTLIVLCATLITTIFVFLNPLNLRSEASGGKSVSFNFEFVTGYNLISFPHDPKLRARNLCKQVPEIVQIARWRIPNWEILDCSQSNVPDFSLLPHRGYFIKVSKSVNWLSTGKAAIPEYHFTGSSSAWGVPPSFTQYTDAHSLCISPDPEYKVTLVLRWYNNAWDSYSCIYPNAENNFELEKGKGYILSTDKL